MSSSAGGERQHSPTRAKTSAGDEKTGIKTFIVGYDGVVDEQDLGPETLAAFQAMDRSDPDESWSPVEEP